MVLVEGDIIVGCTWHSKITNKQMKLLLAWIAIHKDELKANWELLSKGEGYFKIEPLR
jgi:hypothetical protein